MPAQELPSRAAPSVCDVSPYPKVQPQESYPEEGREGGRPPRKKKVESRVIYEPKRPLEVLAGNCCKAFCQLFKKS